MKRSDGTVGYKVRWREGSAHRARTFDRRRDAEAFLAEVKRLKRMGGLDILDSGMETLDEFAAEWLRLYARPRVTVGTLKDYVGLYDRDISPALGSFRLKDLKTVVVAGWQADLSQRKGAATVVRARMVLGNILARAVEWDRLLKNPCRAVPAPTYRRRHRPIPLPPDVVERIRAHLLATRRLRDSTLVSVLAYAGLRPVSEACRLNWADVRDRTLAVYGAKTRRERTVKLLAPLVKDLAELRLASGRPQGLVFPTQRGKQFSEGGWSMWTRKVWATALEEVGVPYTRPYDLRHSFVSLLISEGQNILEIARQAGHSPTFTLETYGHLFDEFDPAERVPAEARIQAARDALVPARYPATTDG